MRTVRSLANSSGTGLPQNPREEPPDAFLASMKRALDATTFDIDPLPSKRARLTRTDGQQPGVGNGKPEQAAEV